MEQTIQSRLFRTLRYTAVFTEMKTDPEHAGTAAMKSGGSEDGRWRALGRETLDGWECEKRAFDYKDKSRGELAARFADKLGYPIKTVYKKGADTMTMESKDIKPGDVDPSLFIVPAGYQRMSMPGMSQGVPPDKNQRMGGKPGMRVVAPDAAREEESGRDNDGVEPTKKGISSGLPDIPLISWWAM